MAQVSYRAELIPASPIRKLVPFAEQAKKKGRKVYHLNIGQPDIPTPNLMLVAVQDYKGPVLEYSHSCGNESYRKKLAAYYTERNMPLTHEDIVITTGGSEAILFSFIIGLNAGDEIIAFEPFYPNYTSFAIMSGVKICAVETKIEQGFALPPIEELEQKINSNTKAIIICNPNNPTGYAYTTAELESLKHLVLKYNLFLFSDEAYRDFSYNGKLKSCLEISGIEEHVVVMDTISKRYSACGARVGAIISRNKKFIASVTKCAQARLSPPGLGQIIGEAALDLPADFFDQPRQEYQKRRDVLVRKLQAIPNTFCTSPAGAFYVMVKLPIDDGDKFCQWMLEEFSYLNSTVMMAPASGFYATKGLGKNEVRIAYVLNCQELEAAIDCLEQGLKAYPGRV